MLSPVARYVVTAKVSACKTESVSYSLQKLTHVSQKEKYFLHYKYNMIMPYKSNLFFYHIVPNLY